MMRKSHNPRYSSGITMIEVLVTMVIVAVGLLGMAVLQLTSVRTQHEAYQRAQAVFLIEDMANRIRVNGDAARNGEYVNGTDYGLQEPDPDETCAEKATLAERDLCEWNLVLAGAPVVLNDTNVGSLVGARACLENLPGSIDGETIVRLTVAWQGMSPTVASASTCGQNSIGADDRFRRTASVDTVLANLAI